MKTKDDLSIELEVNIEKGMCLCFLAGVLAGIMLTGLATIMALSYWEATHYNSL